MMRALIFTLLALSVRAAHWGHGSYLGGVPSYSYSSYPSYSYGSGLYGSLYGSGLGYGWSGLHGSKLHYGTGLGHGYYGYGGVRTLHGGHAGHLTTAIRPSIYSSSIAAAPLTYATTAVKPAPLVSYVKPAVEHVAVAAPAVVAAPKIHHVAHVAQPAVSYVAPRPVVAQPAISYAAAHRAVSYVAPRAASYVAHAPAIRYAAHAPAVVAAHTPAVVAAHTPAVVAAHAPAALSYVSRPAALSYATAAAPISKYISGYTGLSGLSGISGISGYAAPIHSYGTHAYPSYSYASSSLLNPFSYTNTYGHSNYYNYIKK